MSMMEKNKTSQGNRRPRVGDRQMLVSASLRRRCLSHDLKEGVAVCLDVCRRVLQAKGSTAVPAAGPAGVGAQGAETELENCGRKGWREPAAGSLLDILWI